MLPICACVLVRTIYAILLPPRAFNRLLHRPCNGARGATRWRVPVIGVACSPQLAGLPYARPARAKSEARAQRRPEVRVRVELSVAQGVRAASAWNPSVQAR